MPTTANFSLEYPDDNSSVDIAGHFETLADDVDEAINTRLALTGGTLTGALVGTLTTDSSSSTTGAFKTAGGMGIAKALYVGTTLNVTGATTLTGNVISNVSINKANASLGLSSTSGDAQFFIDRTGAGYGTIVIRSGTSSRWTVGTLGGTETGSDANTNFLIGRHSDAGTYLGAALTITRSTGDITLTGNLTISKSLPILNLTGSGLAYTIIQSSNDHARLYLQSENTLGEAGVIFRTGGNNRWVLAKNYANESGSNAGSNLELRAYNDAGSLLSTPLSITRSTGDITLTGALSGTSLSLSSTLSVAGTTTLTGDLTISKTSPRLALSDVAGNQKAIRFETSGALRWFLASNQASESGSNVGSDFVLNSYTDAGAYLSTPLTITRSTGAAQFSGIVQAGTSLGITGGPTWVNDAGKWKTSSSVRIDGTVYAIGGTILFGGAADTSLSRNAATSLLSNSDLTISKATAVQTLSSSSGAVTSNIDRVAGQNGLLRFRTGTSSRWVLRTDNSAESSTAFGSDFSIDSYNNSGVYIESPIFVSRSSGIVTIGNASTAGLSLGYSGPRVMSGTGSPEGVVTAPVGSTWIDTNATTGAIKWIKASGTGNTGWVVEYGDTGRRSLAGVLLNSWTASSISLQRSGNIVTLWARTLIGTSASSAVFYTLPVGFRPTADYVPFPIAVSGGTYAAGRGTVDTAGEVTVGGTVADYTAARLLVSFPTADAWPSSLPGSAA